MDAPSKEEWNDLWLRTRGSPYQKWEFLDVLRSCGKEIVFIYLREEGTLKAGIATIERVIQIGPIKIKILEAHGSPLFEDEDSIHRLLKKIKELRGYSYVTIAPNISSSMNQIFIKANYKEVRNHTSLVKLNKTKEELWTALEKKSIRWGIKTAEKNNLVFEPIREDEVDDFYYLYDQTAREGGFQGESRNMINYLKDTEFSKLFVVKKDNKVIAGGLILIDKQNKISTLDLTGASDEGLRLQAMPFLYWNLILYSKQAGEEIFDLGGYDTEAKRGDKVYNINKYKERFGGDIKEQLIFSSNWKYKFARNSMRSMGLLKRIYKKK